jgi:hypothetical protein
LVSNPGGSGPVGPIARRVGSPYNGLRMYAPSRATRIQPIAAIGRASTPRFEWPVAHPPGAVLQLPHDCEAPLLVRRRDSRPHRRRLKAAVRKRRSLRLVKAEGRDPTQGVEPSRWLEPPAWFVCPSPSPSGLRLAAPRAGDQGPIDRYAPSTRGAPVTFTVATPSGTALPHEDEVGR